jgi:hypothetical protein
LTNTWQHPGPSALPPTIVDGKHVWTVALATGRCGRTHEIKITRSPP